MNSLKKFADRVLPTSVRNNLVSLKDGRELKRVPHRECEPSNLRAGNSIELAELFSSIEAERLWLESQKDVNQFNFPETAGGVNQGDRRAIHYLINQLKPSSVLEVGTHIGASTLHIAAALYHSRVKHGESADLTSVDIIDVNSEEHEPWRKFGAEQSPLEMIRKLGYESFVEFVTDTSLNYAEHCGKKFDFIFLDGDHGASTVYEEIPVALSLLKPNGVILLHDYFPQMKPLWSNNVVIPGPYLAVKRYLAEGAKLAVLPLGSLPWPTKLGSSYTSLALLQRDEHVVSGKVERSAASTDKADVAHA